MNRIPTLLTVVTIVALWAPSIALGWQSQPQELVTIRGTAVTPAGEPAAKVPIVVKTPLRSFPGPDFRTLASWTTAEDGTFRLEFDARNAQARFLQVEFGSKRHSDWLICPVEVQEREIDLGTVRLKPRIDDKEPTGSNLCFAIGWLLLASPLVTLARRLP